METDEVKTLAELRGLDSDEMVRGYITGFDRNAIFPVDGGNKSFIHGWLNGQVDCGRLQSSDAQRELARLIVASRR